MVSNHVNTTLNNECCSILAQKIHLLFRCGRNKRWALLYTSSTSHSPFELIQSMHSLDTDDPFLNIVDPLPPTPLTTTNRYSTTIVFIKDTINASFDH